MSGPDTLTLLAPLAGWSTSLDEAPDEVFATRMLGDGVAIDPTAGTLYAPCDGEVVVLPASRHAVTLRTPGGCEILMHVGIDTVALAGRASSGVVTLGTTRCAANDEASFPEMTLRSGYVSAGRSATPVRRAGGCQRPGR